MRVVAVLVVLLAAGCLGAKAPTTATEVATTTPPVVVNATDNATMPLVGERGDTVAERFYLGADHKLHVAQNASDAGALATVPEAFTGAAFFTTGGSGTTIPAWEGPPSQRAFEVMQDLAITVKITSGQPAASVTKGLQFPPVGGWLGTKDRWAIYFGATDAPDTLEAGKTYALTMTAKMPPAGYFHLVGDPLALHTYIAYQTPDNSPLSYVVGGPDAAGFTMPHSHFNVSAPVATKVLEKTGALSPNPSPTTGTDQAPVLLPFDVPPGTAYLVADLVGASTAGGTPGDADLDLRAGSDVLGQSNGPSPHEVVVLGPTALAKAGGKLVARIASSMYSGGTYKLTVTAYGQ